MLRLTFWGVRGSIPTPEPQNLGYGGNTACIEIRLPDHPPFILDGGSGIRALGQTLKEKTVHIFLTHFHWDHIQGIPYFTPLYDPACHTTIYSHSEPADLSRLLGAQMLPPYYPVPMPSAVSYRQNEAAMGSGDLVIKPFPLNHPNRATGYRIESDGTAIVYASDHEHGDPEADEILRSHAREARILIYDAQYTSDEYELRRGWGHSTWREAVKIARECGVERLILFHHDPSRTDEQLRAIVHQAQGEFENTIAAQEGWSAEL